MRMQMTVVIPTLIKMAILIFKVSDLEIFLILLSLGGGWWEWERGHKVLALTENFSN